MGFILFSSFFKKRLPQPTVTVPAIQTLLAHAEQHAHITFVDTPVFHHKESIDIPFILFDPQRGLYLFERIDWTYTDLQGATLSAVDESNRAMSATQIETHRSFIHQKFQELLHHDGCNSVDFIIMDEITHAEYATLDASFKALLPETRIIFADEQSESVEIKLQNALERQESLYLAADIIGSLFFHMLILPDSLHQTPSLLNPSQQAYLHSQLQSKSILSGLCGSGKTTVMLLKALFEKLLDPALRVMIIVPTLASCEMLKHRLLEIIEHAIIDFDITGIDVITPDELLLRHAKTIYGKKTLQPVQITSKMMTKKFDAADVIFCDDSYLLPKEFVKYLMHIQSKNMLQLIDTACSSEEWQRFTLEGSFRIQEPLLPLCRDHAHVACPINEPCFEAQTVDSLFLHSVLKLQRIIKKNPDATVIIVCPDKIIARRLVDQINEFLGNIAMLFNAYEHLVYHETKHHLAVLPEHLSGLQCSDVIILDPDTIPRQHLCYALHRAQHSVTMLYQNQRGITYA